MTMAPTIVSPMTPRRAPLGVITNAARASPSPAAGKKSAKSASSKKLESARTPVAAPPLTIRVFGETGILQDERGTEPECVEVFGESGVLQAERGEAPASPDVAWPNDWPEDWDAGEWEWEWEEGWWSNGGDEWDWTEWGSETRQEPSMELGPAMRINTHIRFEEPSTPSVGARAKPQTPSSAALAVAVEVANSGGKAVKKSKSKPPALDADDAKSMAKLSAKTLSQIGAQARSARAAARAEMALESSVAPSLSPSTLAKMEA